MLVFNEKALKALPLNESPSEKEGKYEQVSSHLESLQNPQ